MTTVDEGPRGRILEAAAGAIAESGFHGMSMRALARAAGMSLGNSYNYFASKEEILFAIQKGAFEVLIASAGEALAPLAEPSARLYVFVSHHVRYFAEHPEVMRVLVHEASALPEAERREVRRLKERYFALGRSIVADLVAEGCGPGSAESSGPLPVTPTPVEDEPVDDAELDSMSYSLFGMLNWIYGWYRPEKHGTPADVARSIHRLALCGVTPHCPHLGAPELHARLDHHLESVETPPLLGGLPDRLRPAEPPPPPPDR